MDLLIPRITRSELLMSDAGETIEIPNGVTVEVNGKKILVKGPKGQIQRDFTHAESVDIEKSKAGLMLRALSDRKRARSLANTIKTEINNMILGVTKGFTYKLKMAHSHFPISVKVDKERHVVNIENFIGERYPRVAVIDGEVEVTVKGDDLVVSGADKQSVGQTSTNIRRACRIKDKDPRVFQDGIYLYETYCGDELLNKV
jgi:large subunit ribosomal protein L6